MENRLWQMVALRYFSGYIFALKGSEEHRQLCHDPSQLKLFEPPTGSSCIVYTEDISKANQGGLLHCDSR